MSYQPHYIASYEQDSGLFTYTEPFLAPEKAFPTLQNAYCWRGRVKRKSGTILLGRLRRVVTDTLAVNIDSGTLIYNILTGLTTPVTETYAQIQIETSPASITTPLTIVIAAPISQTLKDTIGTGVLTIIGAGPISAATIDYNTGVLTLAFSGVAGASVATITMAYYPGLPVMGCRLQEKPAVNDENTIFFDTTYAYIFNPIAKEFNELPSVAITRWHGTNSDFFWTTNFSQKSGADLFWASNDRMAGATRDPIRYYDSATWTDFTPLITATDNLYNARVIVPYKDRLVMLNTWEGTTVGTITAATNFSNRVRWCWNGDPTDVTAFRSDIVGKGGFLDAPTDEQIISAEFIKDTLLVKFERSSWKLVYTGNEVLPFIFQKINTELGAESTFSLVPFDRGVFGVGNFGVTTDDSVNVERIDLQIPDVAFSFNNDNDGVKRVYGIRDYSNELVYWTYPDFAVNPTYPNRVLCYNYRNNTFAQFLDSFTCYGYWQRPSDLVWFQLPWVNWISWPGIWQSPDNQALFPYVVAGNQQGFISLVQQDNPNDPTLFISTMDTVNSWFISPDHNLRDGDVVEVNGMTGNRASDLNGKTFVVDSLTSNFFNLIGFTINATDTYFGGGTLSIIDNIVISTKLFSPFYEAGSQCRLAYVDYLLDYTDAGEVTGQVYVDENDSISMSDTTANTALIGTNIILTRPENLNLIPFQATQNKIWHRQFTQIVAQNFQLQLTMSTDQLLDTSISGADIVLHAIALYLSPNARLVQ